MYWAIKLPAKLTYQEIGDKVGWTSPETCVHSYVKQFQTAQQHLTHSANHVSQVSMILNLNPFMFA